MMAEPPSAWAPKLLCGVPSLIYGVKNKLLCCKTTEIWGVVS